MHVDLQFQGGYADTIDKYLQSDTGNRPDLVQMPEYMVQQMVDTGLIEEFQVTDGEGRTVTAIRSREKNGNVAPPE